MTSLIAANSLPAGIIIFRGKAEMLPENDKYPSLAGRWEGCERRVHIRRPEIPLKSPYIYSRQRLSTLSAKHSRCHD
jgi:hypothetical protein